MREISPFHVNFVVTASWPCAVMQQHRSMAMDKMNERLPGMQSV